MNRGRALARPVTVRFAGAVPSTIASDVLVGNCGPFVAEALRYVVGNRSDFRVGVNPAESRGNIKPLRSLTEPLPVAKDNGAKRALIPIENKRNFLDVSADIMKHVDPIFYGDPKTAAMKVLGTL